MGELSSEQYKSDQSDNRKNLYKRCTTGPITPV